MFGHPSRDARQIHRGAFYRALVRAPEDLERDMREVGHRLGDFVQVEGRAADLTRALEILAAKVKLTQAGAILCRE